PGDEPARSVLRLALCPPGPAGRSARPAPHRDGAESDGSLADHAARVAPPPPGGRRRAEDPPGARGDEQSARARLAPPRALGPDRRALVAPDSHLSHAARAAGRRALGSARLAGC